MSQYEIFRDCMMERKVNVNGQECMAIPYEIGIDMMELLERQHHRLVKCRNTNDQLDDLASSLLIIVTLNMGINL